MEFFKCWSAGRVEYGNGNFLLIRRDDFFFIMRAFVFNESSLDELFSKMWLLNFCIKIVIFL